MTAIFTLEPGALAEIFAIALSESKEEIPIPAAKAEEFLRKSLLFDVILFPFS
jgi:hypothetical protein